MSTRQIDVGRITGNFYGGLPYSASWNFNDGSSPSTLTISVVNSQGSYPNLDGELSLSRPVTIGLGDFNFTGYLVTYNIEQTPEQKILNLEYVDLSIDLDKYYVGLFKRHGKKTKDSTNLIIVGKEYHPCDTNHDSTVDYEETRPQVDPCDPCPYMPNDKYKSMCDPVRSDFQIWEVFYTFNDLLQQLPVAYFGLSSFNNQYKAQHTGTLKSVLGAWCGELGLAYYWDPFNNSLNFVSRSKPILAPSNLGSIANVIDYKYGATKKNTFSRGFIGYFAKQGEFKQYKCELNDFESFQTTKPLSISDLLGYDSEESSGSKALSCIMARYGRPLRDAYLWFHYYGITDAISANTWVTRLSPGAPPKDLLILEGDYQDLEDVNDMVFPSTGGGGAPDDVDIDTQTDIGGYEQDASAKVLTKLGKMRILKVIHPSLEDANSGEFEAVCRQVLDPVEREGLQDGNLENNSFYFIIADVDDELADSLYDEERNIGQNYIGKYWFKYYSTPIPAADNAHTQVSTETPDGGNATWYISGKDITALPIFGFGHSSDSFIASLAEQVKNDTLDYSRADEDTKLLSTSSFLLANRDAKFLPTNDQIKDYDSLFKWYKEYTPKMMGSDGRPSILFSLWPNAANNNNIKLFLCRDYNDFKISVTPAQHPLEASSMKMKTKTLEDGLGNKIIKNVGLYGLASNMCYKITIGSSNKIDLVIYTPPQSFDFGHGDSSSYSPPSYSSYAQYGEDILTNNSSFPGYVVFVQPSAEFPKVLPKVQYTASINAQSSDVAHLDYNYKEIQEENINAIIGGSSCIPNQAAISSYVKAIGANTTSSMNQPQRTASIKLPGIVPTIFGINQALNSLQITISENGSYTTYNFEDKIIQKPSDDYFYQLLLDKAKQMKSLGSNSTTTNEIGYIKQGLRQ